MRKANSFLLLLFSISFLFSSPVWAQLQKITKANLYTESDIYVSNAGTRYSDLITVKFNKHAVPDKFTSNKINAKPLLVNDIQNYLLSLKDLYGDFEVIKCFPDKMWGDTITTNKRTHKNVVIADLSQLVRLRFSKLVPVDSIIENMNTQPFIAYAQGPEVLQECTAPNDPLYSSASHWAFDQINAEKAWNITRGNDEILISVNDDFAGAPIHVELADKVIYNNTRGKYQGHGGAIAGIAGAMTNSNLGIASLGWNLKLMLHDWGYESIIDAISRGADIINLSWISTDCPALRDAIRNALLAGVIVVAGAGNQLGNVSYIPSIQYPAAYNFGREGQVIAVSATRWDGSNESFVDGWNYSPGIDPVKDPTNSFIDISAPGMGIEILSGFDEYSPMGAGTSDSAPFVSALCGLILSINPELTPNQVYEILTNSADKIGQYPYSNGWNRYMGYGRINAYNALNYTIQHFGGSLTESNIISGPVKYSLENNYPNPFNPSTTIQYELPVSGFVSLKVFDILGTEVKTLVTENETSGKHAVNFDASHLSSGVYFYRLEAGNFVSTKKMTLIK